MVFRRILFLVLAMAMTVMASSRILSSDPSSVDSSNAWKDQMNTRRRLEEGTGSANPSLTNDAPPENNDAPAGNEDSADADAGDEDAADHDDEDDGDTDGDDADKGIKTPVDDGNRDTVGSGDDASDGKSKNPIIDQEIVDNAQETPANPSSAPSNQDPCQVAKTCDKCQSKAAELFDKQAENTCAYVKGEDDLIYCQTVNKSTITNPDMDQCSKPKTEDKKPTSPPVPAPIPSNQNMVVSDDEESNIGAILGFILLLTCGCAVFKLRRKVKAQLTATLGAGAGSAVKTTKYHELAVEEENDEEWGWGDDEGETGGDVELASSFKDDSSVHKRRTSSNESLPTSKTSPMFHKKSPHVSSQAKSHSATEPHTIPKLPKTIPQAPISGSGMSLTAISKPGINRTTPALTPASASVSEFSHLQGMKITTLGPKRNAPATPAKKAPVSAPSPEEDIFASMGLAAKPIFSQAAAPVTSPALMSSRWNVPSVVPVATIATTTATSFGGDDDENWDDDGDLDDLLDD